MKVVVRFTEAEEARALPILLRHSPGIVLPNRTYVLDEHAVAALRGSGVGFAESFVVSLNSLGNTGPNESKETTNSASRRGTGDAPGNP